MIRVGERLPTVVVVGNDRQAAAAVAARLPRVAASARVVSCAAKEAFASATLMTRLVGSGALVLGPSLTATDGKRLAEAAQRLGVSVVLAGEVEGTGTNSDAVRSTSRLLDPAAVALVRETHSGALGHLTSVAVRSPGGRRQPRPGSTRTPFADRAHVRVEFSEAELESFCKTAVDAFSFVNAILPGAGSILEVSELVAHPQANRLVAQAKVGETFVEVELDEEMNGEGPLEVEACFQGIKLSCRFGPQGGSLSRVAALLKPRMDLAEEPTSIEYAVMHALARVGSSIPSPASLSGARVSEGLVRGAVARYRDRVEARPLEFVLVHVPRYRNQFDELELPSLAAARLTAFARGHGWNTRVVDLQIAHARDPLECFTEDTAVESWLEGKSVPSVDSSVSLLWSTLGPVLQDARARGVRCLVGLSLVDYFGHFQMSIAACLARRVKEVHGFPTVLGGERDQVDGNRALSVPNTFDYVVDGDGEVPLLGLLHLEAYGDRAAKSIPGVWSRENEVLHKNKLIRSHLNAMPTPDFDDVDRNAYLGKPPKHILDKLRADGLLTAEDPAPFCYFPYAFVKGCTAKCEFCSSKEWLDVQTPEKSADDLLFLSEKYQVKDFVFLNNLVNVGPKLLERFCRRLIDSKAGLQWTDSCRPTGISRELAALMRESGCLLLNYGAESGSDKILDLMKKGLSAKDIVETLRNTHEAGIVNRVNFIAGYFHETPEDVDATIKLVETLSEQIDIIGCFQGFYLFPGMGVVPEEAGVVLRPGLDTLKTGQVTLGYDEIGGLKWEEKRDTIDASRNRILNRMESLGIRTVDKINEYALFWMSRRYDKKTVRQYLINDGAVAELRPNQANLLPGGQQGRVTKSSTALEG